MKRKVYCSLCEQEYTLDELSMPHGCKGNEHNEKRIRALKQAYATFYKRVCCTAVLSDELLEEIKRTRKEIESIGL